MSALVQSRLSPATAHEAMITARRYGGEDALAAGIVDATAAEQDVRQTAIDLARPHVAKAGPTLRTIRVRMYGPALDALADAAPLG
jgi:enoyl-CoA hydratase/carnithine racemase